MLTKEQRDRAYALFYGEGMALGEIAQELGCGIYDLSPWLTRPLMRIAMQATEEKMQEIERLEKELSECKEVSNRHCLNHLAAEEKIRDLEWALTLETSDCFSCGARLDEDCPRHHAKICGREHEGGSRAATKRGE